jgi:hypothetical protein
LFADLEFEDDEDYSTPSKKPKLDTELNDDEENDDE